MPQKLWIIVHEHRFGNDIFPVYCDNNLFDLDSFAKTLVDFEPDRDDEWLNVAGPFDLNTIPQFPAA